jgi:hypothetical protein
MKQKVTRELVEKIATAEVGFHESMKHKHTPITWYGLGVFFAWLLGIAVAVVGSIAYWIATYQSSLKEGSNLFMDGAGCMLGYMAIITIITATVISLKKDFFD